MPGILLAMNSKPNITGFPAEILIMIFTFYLMTLEGLDQMKHLLRIAAVCQRFRNVIVHSPLLLANTFHLNAPRVWVDTYLRYLNVNEHVAIPQIQPQHSSAWQLRLLLCRPYALVERTRSLVLETSTAMWAGMTRILARMDTHKISNLEIKFIPHGRRSSSSDDDAEIISPFKLGTTCHNITSLTLTDGVFHLPAASFPSLTRLSARSNVRRAQGRMTAPEWLDFLRSSPQLLSLTLHNVIKPEPPTSQQRIAAHRMSSVTMPNLQEFEIRDSQIEDLGDLLNHLCIAPSCNMSISALVCTEVPASVNAGTGDTDYIGGLLSFLHTHFNQPNAPTFGPNLVIHAAEIKSTHALETISFRNFVDKTPSAVYIPQLYHSQTGVSGQHIPRLDITVITLRDASDHASTFNDLYHAVHEKLVLSALSIPLRSVTNLNLNFSNRYFTESTVQRLFFQALPNVQRLDVFNGRSLFDLRKILDNNYIRQRPFPRLRILGLNDIDFTRKWDQEDRNLPMFDDPFNMAWAVLGNLVQGLTEGAVERVELFACENYDGLQSHLEEFGVEVVPQ